MKLCRINLTTISFFHSFFNAFRPLLFDHPTLVSFLVFQWSFWLPPRKNMKRENRLHNKYLFTALRKTMNCAIEKCKMTTDNSLLDMAYWTDDRRRKKVCAFTCVIFIYGGMSLVANKMPALLLSGINSKLEYAKRTSNNNNSTNGRQHEEN